MSYRDQWQALSARIHGLMQASDHHVALLALHDVDSYGRWKTLQGHCGRIVEALQAFQAAHRETLPPMAQERLATLLGETGLMLKNSTDTVELQQERAQSVLVTLVAFESEMSFLLSGSEELIRSRSDRAFEHLQRSLVVDARLREDWSRAFGDGEVECERLGAIHLLLHGIWAFKVDAKGERTDLVYSEPLTDLGSVARAAEGLVLTEWKRAARAEEAAGKFAEGRRQAGRYAKGALAGIELTRYRYAVVVSEHHLEVPGDLHDGGIVYRHINIAVRPRSPSR